MPLNELYRLDVDVLAPCLESEALTEASVRELRVKIVCGGADGQLADDRLSVALADRGVLYVPDYVANAGGLISDLGDLSGMSRQAVERRVAAIHDTSLGVFARAEADGVATSTAAERMALEIISGRITARSASTAVA